MGVVYYANYLVWMELGRVEYSRARGIRYRDMEEQDHVLLVVAEANCRYRRPARYDDEVIIRTWISESTPRTIRFEYEMLGAVEGNTLAMGFTRHVICGRDVRPTKLPEKYWPMFGISARRPDPEDQDNAPA
jgi:acyl-CoA thioester hydrolase